MSFLPLSDNAKEAILQKLREGYDRRDIRAAIQRHFNERIRDLFPVVVSQHPLQYMLFIVISLSIRKMFITYKKVQELSYKKHDEQKESSFD